MCFLCVCHSVKYEYYKYHPMEEVSGIHFTSVRKMKRRP